MPIRWATNPNPQIKAVRKRIKVAWNWFTEDSKLKLCERMVFLLSVRDGLDPEMMKDVLNQGTQVPIIIH